MIIAGKALTGIFRRGATQGAPVGRMYASRVRASLTKDDIIKIVSQKTGMTQVDAKSAVDGVFDTIVNSVAKGEKVSLAGFGIFERVTRAARKGRNPKTGEEIDIAEKNVPAFKASKTFKDTVVGGK